MNEQSLKIANDLLAAAAAEVQQGELLKRSPVELGRSVGVQDPLPIARAVRALISRERLRPVGEGYELVRSDPVSPGEKGKARPRTRRPVKGAKRLPSAWDVKVGQGNGQVKSRPLTYSDMGKAVIDALIQLGRRAGEAEGSLQGADQRVKAAEQGAQAAERRARAAEDEARELALKLEMAEANLKNVLSAARGRTATTAPSEDEMAAILNILKSNTSSNDGDLGSAL